MMTDNKQIPKKIRKNLRFRLSVIAGGKQKARALDLEQRRKYARKPNKRNEIACYQKVKEYSTRSKANADSMPSSSRSGCLVTVATPSCDGFPFQHLLHPAPLPDAFPFTLLPRGGRQLLIDQELRPGAFYVMISGIPVEWIERLVMLDQFSETLMVGIPDLSVEANTVSIHLRSMVESFLEPFPTDGLSLVLETCVYNNDEVFCVNSPCAFVRCRNMNESQQIVEAKDNHHMQWNNSLKYARQLSPPVALRVVAVSETQVPGIAQCFTLKPIRLPLLIRPPLNVEAVRHLSTSSIGDKFIMSSKLIDTMSSLTNEQALHVVNVEIGDLVSGFGLNETEILSLVGLLHNEILLYLIKNRQLKWQLSTAIKKVDSRKRSQPESSHHSKVHSFMQKFSSKQLKKNDHLSSQTTASASDQSSKQKSRGTSSNAHSLPATAEVVSGQNLPSNRFGPPPLSVFARNFAAARARQAAAYASCSDGEFNFLNPQSPVALPPPPPTSSSTGPYYIDTSQYGQTTSETPELVVPPECSQNPQMITSLLKQILTKITANTMKFDHNLLIPIVTKLAATSETNQSLASVILASLFEMREMESRSRQLPVGHSQQPVSSMSLPERYSSGAHGQQRRYFRMNDNGDGSRQNQTDQYSLDSLMADAMDLVDD